MTPGVVLAKPEIKAYFGRDVILGIRPSDFEDASLTDESRARMPVVSHVTEVLGSEIHVIFAIDAPPVEHKDVAELAPQGEEEESAIPFHEGKSLWTARVSARSSVRVGDGSSWGSIPARCTSLTQKAADDRRLTSKPARASGGGKAAAPRSGKR